SLVIDTEGGDAAGGRLVHHVGRVEAAAQPDFDDAGVRRMAGESEERGSGGDFEEARPQFLADIEHLLQQRGQFFVRNQLAGDADAFVVADEVRLYGGVDG